ncbi:MAG: minor capsid protein [Clostridiales bacterium]|nr:minor capsid protein [Clostridiales bacterium]
MKLEVHGDFEPILHRLSTIGDISAKARLFAHERFRAYMEPYVPMREGILMAGVDVTPEYVWYKSPYAHYQYEGEVYGPNIPVRDADGNIIRWFSPPVKQPTGRAIRYSTDLHPLAQAHWDEGAMAAHQGDLEDEIAAFIEREEMHYA